MIECTEAYIYYNDKRKAKKRRKIRYNRLFIFIVVIAALGIAFYNANNASFDLVFKICESETEKSALKSINKAINFTLSDEIKYSDLISVKHDKNGDVSLMTANSFKVNSLCRTVAEKTEEELTAELKDGCKVPILAFTGLKWFSGMGFKVDYKAIRIGAVNCEFISDFSSVGINQTLHALFFRINCEITVGFLYKNKTTTVSSDVLIGQSVLVGKVPEVYLNGNT